MIGLLFLTIIVAYIAISTALVKWVFRSNQSLPIKVAISTFVVIFPFWDMFLHYPVLAYMRSNFVEIERLQPYKKVDGFFVDYVPRDNVAYSMLLYKAFENNYSIYFEGYELDRKGVYKATWLNDSSSRYCAKPWPVDEYFKIANNNWCVSVRPAASDDRPKYWKLSQKKVFSFPILYMNLYVVDFFVSDRTTGEHFLRLRDVYVDKSWMTALNVVSARKSRQSGTKYTYAASEKSFVFPDYNVIKLLDSEQLPDLQLSSN